MKRKLTMAQKSFTFEEGVKRFLESRKVKGVSEKTIESF